jgi:sialate O-acetylesterase
LHRLLLHTLPCFVIAASALSAQATVTLPHLLSDHAVLQRGVPIHIWGNADPREKVAVTFHGAEAQTTTDGLGHWSVYLPAEQAGGPYTLTVKGSNTITLSDLLVGDVWFASGQSNMQFPLLGFGPTMLLKNGAEEISNATHSRIRLLFIPNLSSNYEQADQPNSWMLCTPETAAHFSAVAYFFGRDLQEQEHVPIGLIDSSWGGTPVSSWLSLAGLSADASLMPEFAARVPMVEDQVNVAPMLAEEKRDDAAAKAAGRPAPAHSWHPDSVSWQPAGLFNAMVAPALPYAIKGAIWYQGETDTSADRAPYYNIAFPAMITDWRSRWQEGDFPFLFVQISSYNDDPAHDWGMVREAQRRTLRLADTGMAVTTDLGEADNIHPPDKQAVGHRLALAARALAYGEKVEDSGPIFRQATIEGGRMHVYFTHGEGLRARTGALSGFEVAGNDGRFFPATAKLEDNAVTVSAASVADPKYVRYAWANNAFDADLVNSADLPASTFTSQERIPTLQAKAK